MRRYDVAGQDLSAIISEYVAEFSEASAPGWVLGAEKLFLLDWIGAVASGVGTPGCAQLSDLVRETYRQSGSTVLFQDCTAPPPEAAMVNSAQAQAWELDDVFDEALVRPRSSILAGTMAVAEQLGEVTPRRMLAASAVGTEVLCRLARAITSPLSWSRTTTLGAVAVAASCGRLLGLDALGVRNAMGLAYCQSAGTLQPSVEGKSAKRLQVGFAARAGVTAALLAGKGVDGPLDFLEGRFGYYRQYERNSYERDRALEGLGTRFFSTEVSVRSFPGARESHPAYEAASRLVREGDLSAGVSAVRIFVTPDAANVVGNPLPEGRIGPAAALTSVRYGVACLLATGRLDVGSYHEVSLGDEELLRLARGAEMGIVPDASPGAIVPARVEVELRDGRNTSAQVDRIESGVKPEMQPWIVEKALRGLRTSRAAVSAETATSVVSLVLGLESVELNRLFSLLR